jgi:GT2 family glycosyltransferase
MDLSIIIVNFNSATFTINCIDSIVGSNMRMKYEIIVVDNASDVHDEEKIRKRFPSVNWIQTGYNAGFARANNAGIRASKGDCILLLNADTIVKNNSIDKVYHQFSSQEKYIACGVQLLNEDGTHQHSGAKFIKGGANILLPLPYLGKMIKSLAQIFQVKQPNVFSVNKDEDVDWIIGAFILTKRVYIEKAGMLDEDFFMYAEEIEWCSRLRKFGPMVLFANADIIHLGGGSSSNYYNMKQYDNSRDIWSKKARQIIVSQMLRVRKQWGIFWYLFNLFAYYIEIPIFGIGFLLESLFRAKNKDFEFSQFAGFAKNMILSLPFFMDILLNRHKFYKVN